LLEGLRPSWPGGGCDCGGGGVTAAPVFFALVSLMHSDDGLPWRGTETHATSSCYLDLRNKRVRETKEIEMNVELSEGS
jgi:hypothetical protein